MDMRVCSCTCGRVGLSYGCIYIYIYNISNMYQIYREREREEGGREREEKRD